MSGEDKILTSGLSNDILTEENLADSFDSTNKIDNSIILNDQNLKLPMIDATKNSSINSNNFLEKLDTSIKSAANDSSEVITENNVFKIDASKLRSSINLSLNTKQILPEVSKIRSSLSSLTVLNPAIFLSNSKVSTERGLLNEKNLIDSGATNLAQISASKTSDDTNTICESCKFSENSLRESIESISFFDKNHMGRLSSSSVYPVNSSLVEESEIVEDLHDRCQVDFSIPTYPTGQLFSFHILSTWGDLNYIGLSGIEIFDKFGHVIPFSKYSAITADPASVNVLPGINFDFSFVKFQVTRRIHALWAIYLMALILLAMICMFG